MRLVVVSKDNKLTLWNPKSVISSYSLPSQFGSINHIALGESNHFKIESFFYVSTQIVKIFTKNQYL